MLLIMDIENEGKWTGKLVCPGVWNFAPKERNFFNDDTLIDCRAKKGDIRDV